MRYESRKNMLAVIKNLPKYQPCVKFKQKTEQERENDELFHALLDNEKNKTYAKVSVIMIWGLFNALFAAYTIFYKNASFIRYSDMPKL